MAFTTNPYCTLTQVHNALAIPTSQTVDDAWISGDLIPQAQAFIDRYLGYSFQTDGTTGTPATRTYDGNETDSLMIDRCVSITQVLETGYSTILGVFGVIENVAGPQTDITADVFMGPIAVVNNDGYGYILQRISKLPFFEGALNYTVKGVFGVPAIPADISRACIRIVVNYYKMRDANYTQTVATGQFGAAKFDPTAPADAIEILDRYRRKGFFTRG
jgi:hypothetical protein